MECHLRYGHLQTTELIVFAVLFIILGLASSIINTMSFKLMYSAMNVANQAKTVNYKSLVSLAATGCLSGFVLLPMNVVQMLSRPSRMNCLIDQSRAFLTVIVNWNIAFTISLIAFERYLILNRNQRLKKKQFWVMLPCSWILPLVVPLLRFVNEHLYYISVCLGMLLPYVVLSLSYFYIMKEVKSQEHKLLLHYFQRDFMDSDEAKSIKLKKRHTRKHLKVAKVVSVLIIAYFVCTTPILLWFINELLQGSFDVLPIRTRQCFYAASTVLCCMNSCLNPPVYFGKIPEFQKQLKRTTKILKHSAINERKSNTVTSELVQMK